MGTRSVRLDDEAEAALAEITGSTGMSISQAIKQGLVTYRNATREQREISPSDFFDHFDLGEGGYAIAPARDASSAVREKLRNRRKK